MTGPTAVERVALDALRLLPEQLVAAGVRSEESEPHVVALREALLTGIGRRVVRDLEVAERVIDLDEPPPALAEAEQVEPEPEVVAEGRVVDRLVEQGFENGGQCQWSNCARGSRSLSKNGAPGKYCSDLHKRFAHNYHQAVRKAQKDGRPKPAVPPVDYGAERRAREAHQALAAPGETGEGARGKAASAVGAPSPPPVSQPTGRCGRCDEPGHVVEDCPRPISGGRRKAVEPERLSDEDVERLLSKFGRDAKDRTPAEERDWVPLGSTDRSKAKRRSIRPSHDVWVPPTTAGALLPEDRELGERAMSYREEWHSGLPSTRGFSYLPDVLALYGLDEALVESALRHPERVEVRPESFEESKRYVVLGFYRGDVMVVLGLRDPASPCVIAVYVDSRLGSDTYRPDHHGKSGGSRGHRGLPANVKQSVRRLRDAGCEVVISSRDVGAVPVKYHGQEVGWISATVGDPPRDPSKSTVESDYQRILRRVDGIDRAEASPSLSK